MTARTGVAGIVLALATSSANAYEIETHGELTERAFLRSVVASSSVKWGRLGLQYGPNDDRQKFLDSKGQSATVLQLLRRGAAYEDDILPLPPRPLHHFYDPATGKGLSVDTVPLEGVLAPDVLNLIALVNATNQSSPDWVLDSPVVNEFSRPHLSDAMYKAYTSRDAATRRAMTGRMFEIVGRLVHHVQDMAQPQHVRNDAHLHDERLESACPARWQPFLEDPLCPLYRALRAPSSYELWTKRLPADALPLSGYANVYGDDGDGSFYRARRFWSNGGKGLAEFTSRNFFSAGTLSRTPPLRGAPLDVSVADLCAAAQPLPCPAVQADHVVRFFPSTVDDVLRPQAGGVNPHAAAESIFDADFRRIVAGDPVPTLNRFTFQQAHAYLLPRAVAYSAGLIDYLFRGAIDAEPPAEGVYGIVDTSLDGCDNPCGFRKLKVRLRNVTPGSETMGPGELRLVAKYRRNGCHRPDLAGHFGGPHFAGNACRLEERVSVSDPLPVVSSVARGLFGEERSFAFPGLELVPADATDLQLQVVFRGRLGEEADAVAVSTIDVAEPNFIAVANSTDHYFDADANAYRPSTGGIHPYRMESVKIWFADPAGQATPIASLAGLEAGQHAQLAVLGDRSGVRYWLRDVTQGVSYPDKEGATFPMQEFVLDESGAAPVYRTNCPVVLARGVYRQYVEMYIRDDRGTRFVPSSGAGNEAAKRRAGAKLAAMTCHDWVAPGDGGITDFSTLTPQFTPQTASTWAVQF